ncbi:MAG: hypothetical protein Q8N81_05730 [bacterium]|nr:hypothetical protein [bacterium]
MKKERVVRMSEIEVSTLFYTDAEIRRGVEERRLAEKKQKEEKRQRTRTRTRQR